MDADQTPRMIVLCDEYTWCIWAPQMYVFIVLYSLYGVVHGLGDSVRSLVGEGDAVPPVLQSTLSLLAWSPLISVLVAPIVEAIHIPYVGRRKTWLVGTEYAVGAVMLFMLPISGSVTKSPDLPLGTVSAVFLAIALVILHLLAAFHEIAADAWGKNYVHHNALALCCGLGRAIGMFVGDTLFQSLESAAFCNQYLRVTPSDTGIVTLGLFLWICGLLLTAGATCFLLGVPENLITPTTVQPGSGGDDRAVQLNSGSESTSIQGVDEIWDKYGKLVDVLSLPAIHSLVFYLAVMEIGCGVERLASDRMIEGGINNYHLVFTRRLSSVITPIFVRVYLCNETVIHPLPATINALKYRMLFGQVFIILIALMHFVPQTDEHDFPFIFNFIVLIAHGLHQATVTTMFVSLLSFFYKISDASVGGIYLTLLKSATLTGSKWPPALGKSLATELTWHGCMVPNVGCVKFDPGVTNCAPPLTSCVLMDGMLVSMVLCFIIGLVWLYVSSSLVADLQSTRADSWTIDSLYRAPPLPPPQPSPRRLRSRELSRSSRSRSRWRSPSRSR